MNGTQVQSGIVTPKKFSPVWVCRHCKAEKIIKLGMAEPKRCWNYKCRRMDWDRDKIKEGRPRGSKAKTQRSKHGRGRK